MRGQRYNYFSKKQNRSDEFFLHENFGLQNAHIGLLCCAFVALFRTKIISSFTILCAGRVFVSSFCTRTSVAERLTEKSQRFCPCDFVYHIIYYQYRLIPARILLISRSNVLGAIRLVTYNLRYRNSHSVCVLVR